MHWNHETFTLYAVTDRTWLGEKTLCEVVEEALKGGVTCVQLREKHLDYVQFYVRFVDAIRPDPKTGKKHLIVTQQMAETEEAV